jgi:hypothetical protein
VGVVPAAASNDAPLIRAKADGKYLLAAELLAGQLAHIYFALTAHTGIAGVADVGIMLPDNSLAARAM